MNQVKSILIVCLGNICRSPTAEGVLKHLLATQAPGLKVEVDSAGTGDYHVGEPPDARSQRVARARGIDLSGLRARQVVPADFARFDLILPMDRGNLRALEAMRPHGSTAQLALFLEYAGAGSAHLQGGEVPDPYFGEIADFERMLDIVTAGARGLIARLKDGA